MMSSLNTFKQSFDPQLITYIQNVISSYCATCSDEYISQIIHQVEPLVASGGKRARPYVATQAYRAARGMQEDQSVLLGIALELFHVFCLIHDDIMDNGHVRHGVETIHTYALRVLPNDRVGNTTAVSNAHALLVGDVVFSWAQQCFYSLSHIQNLPRLKEAWQSMIEQVVLGQMMDIDSTTRVTCSYEYIHQKIQLKTASYTFVWPMILGVSLAQEQPAADVISFCNRFGTALGEAFQIQDDLLDIIGDPEITKKEVLSDIRERQHTYLTSYIFDHGTDEQKQQLLVWFGNTNIPSQQEVISFFEQTGALSFVRKKRDDAFSVCETLLQQAPFDTESVAIFSDLVAYIKQRAM